MTMQPINWSEMDQKYWINDIDGEVLWFESSLDTKAAALEVALKQAALDERAAIVVYLRECEAIHQTNLRDGIDKTASKHHANACHYAARAIEEAEHHYQPPVATRA